MHSRLQRTELHHWWFVARRKIIFDLILMQLPQHHRTQILDVGCGTGCNIQKLNSHGYNNVIGLDISQAALRFCQTQNVKKTVCGDVILLPFPDNSFDMSLALDLIEYVQDDLAALKELARILKPGGSLVIFAPAYKFLWSFHDEAKHHIRRYEINDLQSKMQQAGLSITKLTYANTFLFPLVFAERIITRVMGRPKYINSEDDLHPSWSSMFLRNTFAFESSLLRHIDFPFGVSIICIARK